MRIEDQVRPWILKTVSGANLEPFSHYQGESGVFLKVKAAVITSLNPYQCCILDTRRGGNISNTGRGQTGNITTKLLTLDRTAYNYIISHLEAMSGFLLHYAKKGNWALRGLMIFCGSIMSADVAPEAPPSRAPQVILHPVLSEPGWVCLLYIKF